MSNFIRKYWSPVAYITLALGALLSYKPMVARMIPQTAWVKIASGKVTASIILGLLLWQLAVDNISKKRNWSKKKSWIVAVSGLIVMLVVASTPSV